MKPPGEATVSLPLATTLVRQGFGILLVDLDLRHPTLARVLATGARDGRVDDAPVPTHAPLPLTTVMLREPAPLELIPAFSGVHHPTESTAGGQWTLLIKAHGAGVSVIDAAAEMSVDDTPPVCTIASAPVAAVSGQCPA